MKRELGVFGATMMGLGSIVGTGVFVSIGIAAGIAGPAVVLAILLAAAVAACNALSSAQLAACHPVSGGTYEYGYRRLNPTLGFAAGWMFLCAKTASAATAALGLAGYVANVAELNSDWRVPLGIAAVAALTGLALAGLRLSNQVNIALVSVTLASLAAFMAAGLSEASASRLAFELEPAPLLHSAALMFVAFTGYGRIATLGEEVVDPHRTIPRAIIATVVAAAAVYVGVAVVAVGAAGAEGVRRATESGAPLETLARDFPLRVHGLVAVGAVTAMLGVMLNLLLGLSRVLLAMGRRGDMPGAAAKLPVATIAAGAAIAALAALGSIETTWTFSAFTVLVYYAVTNLAALRLGPEERLFSPAWAWCGLAACLALAFAIEPRAWATGLGVLGIGLAWHWARRRRRGRDLA